MKKILVLVLLGFIFIINFSIGREILGGTPVSEITTNYSTNAGALGGIEASQYARNTGSYSGFTAGESLHTINSETAKRADYALDGDWHYGKIKIVANSGGDYSSITEAINSLAPSGDGGGTTTVYVMAGKYYENIIQKHVKIVGIAGKMGNHPVVYSTSRHIFDDGISGMTFLIDTIFNDTIFAEVTTTGWSPRITECTFINVGFAVNTGIYVHGSVLFVNNETIMSSTCDRVTLFAIDSGNYDNVVMGCKGTLYGSNANKAQISRVFDISPTSRFMFSENWYTMYNYYGYSASTTPENLSAIIYAGIGGDGNSTWEREILYNNLGISFADNTTNAVFIYTCSSTFNNIYFNKCYCDGDSYPDGIANTYYGGIWITGSMKRDVNGGYNIHNKIGGNIFSNNTSTYIPQYYGESSVYTFFQIDPIVTPSLEVFGTATITRQLYAKATGANSSDTATHATEAVTATISSTLITTSNVTVDTLYATSSVNGVHSGNGSHLIGISNASTANYAPSTGIATTAYNSYGSTTTQGVRYLEGGETPSSGTFYGEIILYNDMSNSLGKLMVWGYDGDLGFDQWITITQWNWGGCGAGSCPRIDAWINGKWVEVGRAIYMKNTLSKRGEWDINLNTPAKKFRLVEDEVETSYIDWIKSNDEIVIKNVVTKPAKYKGGEGTVIEFEFSNFVNSIQTHGYYDVSK